MLCSLLNLLCFMFFLPYHHSMERVQTWCDSLWNWIRRLNPRRLCGTAERVTLTPWSDSMFWYIMPVMNHKIHHKGAMKRLFWNNLIKYSYQDDYFIIVLISMHPVKFSRSKACRNAEVHMCWSLFTCTFHSSKSVKMFFPIPYSLVCLVSICVLYLSPGISRI